MTRDPSGARAHPSTVWKIRVDVGGTFTDCVARPPGEPSRMIRAKVLSSARVRGRVLQWLPGGAARIEGFDLPPAAAGYLRLGRPDAAEDAAVARFDPDAGTIELSGRPPDGPVPGVWELRADEPAPVLAARIVTRTAFGDPLPPLDLRLATTRGTNALLERRIEAPAFFVTTGFEDLLRIGDQRRPDLFAMDVRRPPPLHGEVAGVAGRVTRAGAVLIPLDLAAVRAEACRLRANGYRSAAVAVLHADVAPETEARIAAILREEGFEHVSLSSDLSGAIGLLARAETAVANAALAPVVEGYLRRVAAHAGEERMQVMTSAGGLVPIRRFRPKDSLLSGPAAGVTGARRIARRAGVRRAIAFDMGGTSTDVCRIEAERVHLLREHTVGGATIRAAAVPVHTVAAGGGSICRHDARGLGVGPESAGANPGPACYGAGGPLTVTDLNLLLGRLQEDWLAVPVDPAAARRALEALHAALPDSVPPDALLSGLLEIANERMASAIRRVSIEQGHDPAEHALIAFGGAGGQHACAIARRLGIREVLVPEDAGILSAHGLDAASVEALAERQVLAPFDEVEDRLPEWMTELEAEALAELDDAEAPAAIRRRVADLRYRGQESTLAIESGDAESLPEAFEREYRRLFGHVPAGRVLEVVSLRVLAAAGSADETEAETPAPHAAPDAGSVSFWARGGWHDASSHERNDLRPGAVIDGPALVRDRHGVVVIEPGWRGVLDGWRTLRLQALVQGGAALSATPQAAEAQRPEAVLDELFTQRFTAIVEEMGARLGRSAVSVNIRERLDFSCALLDGRGELVASAPHIPVHLGALGVCVRAVRERLPLGAGDVALTNHPGWGGSHLPDMTVIAPVFGDDRGRPLAYVAARAHHAEIGGAAPGSMPPGATCLAEEGVVVPPIHLVRSGEPQWERVARLLRGGRFPSRAVPDNLADLEAALAACRFGVEAVEHLARREGAAEVARRMDRLSSRAEAAIRRAIRARPDGVRTRVERLDDGSPIAVRAEVRGDEMVISFAGTAGTHPGNLNATPAIVRSAALYVLRLLVDEPLPLNEGAFRVVSLHLPEGMLNPVFPDDPWRCPAVVGGNVETSQRLTDTLIGALDIAAASQGTMNNLLFGNEAFGYYETIGGGSGGGPGWSGASGTQVHMTNTRITDPEVLEHRYPVRVRRFALRRGSGGRGKWPGGDGLVRELEFTAPLEISILSQHRVERPFGRHGGEPGAAGRQYVLRSAGGSHPLSGVDGCAVVAGDRLVVETPGGGGWGADGERESGGRGRSTA